jgi:hypothetical protein
MVLAVTVPVLCVPVLYRMQLGSSRWIIDVLCADALIGFGMALVLYRSIRSKLNDLASVLFPPDTAAPEDPAAMSGLFTQLS